MNPEKIVDKGLALIVSIVLSLPFFMVYPVEAMSPGSTLPGFQLTSRGNRFGPWMRYRVCQA